jgi:hypothetical protein
VGEEVLVLGGEDRLAHHGWDLVVLEDAPIFARELDEHLAAGVRDLADRGRLESDEGIQVGNAGPVEVEMMGAGADGDHHETGGGQGAEAAMRDHRTHAHPSRPHPRAQAGQEKGDVHGGHGGGESGRTRTRKRCLTRKRVGRVGWILGVHGVPGGR